MKYWRAKESKDQCYISLDKHIRLYKDTERDSRINKESFSKLVKSRETEILELRKGKEEADSKLKLCNVAASEKDRQVSGKNELLQEKENLLTERRSELEDLTERFNKLQKEYEKVSKMEKELEDGRQSLITQLAESKNDAQYKSSQINIAKLEKKEYQQETQLIQSKLNEQTLEKRLLEKENMELEQKLASLQKGYDDLNQWLMESKKNIESEKLKQNVDKLEEIMENVNVENLPDNNQLNQKDMEKNNPLNDIVIPAPNEDLDQKNSDDLIVRDNLKKHNNNNDNLGDDQQKYVDTNKNEEDNNNVGVLPPPKKVDEPIKDVLVKSNSKEEEIIKIDGEQNNVLDIPEVDDEKPKKADINENKENAIVDFEDLNVENNNLEQLRIKEAIDDKNNNFDNKIQKMPEGPAEGVNPRNNRVVEDNIINIHESMDEKEEKIEGVKVDSINLAKNMNKDIVGPADLEDKSQKNMRKIDGDKDDINEVDGNIDKFGGEKRKELIVDSENKIVDSDAKNVDNVVKENARRRDENR